MLYKKDVTIQLVVVIPFSLAVVRNIGPVLKSHAYFKFLF